MKTALRELVELFQELHGPLEDAREIEQRVGVKRLPVLLQRHAVDLPDAPGEDDVQIPPESGNRFGNARGERSRRSSVPLPGVIRGTVGRRKPGAAELVATWS